jgi:hypothetical protein
MSVNVFSVFEESHQRKKGRFINTNITSAQSGMKLMYTVIKSEVCTRHVISYN